MSFAAEMTKVPRFSNVGLALAQFAESLSDRNLVNVGKRSLPEGKIFVTFQVQAARSQDFVMTLREVPSEAAANDIDRAWRLYSRGRMRQRTSPITLEE